MTASDRALLELGRALRTHGYQFTTVTPESHRRVNSRAENNVARSVRDVFGWSRPFDPAILPKHLLDLLQQSGCLIEEGGLLRSAVRVSTHGSASYIHSAYPTTSSDAVFFGPDTYRFLTLLENLAPAAARAVDIGCGTGAGGLSIAAACSEVFLTDINPLALRYATINAQLNDVANTTVIASNILGNVEGQFDLIVSNPPYLIDEENRTYRNGGGRFGEGLSLDIVRQSLERLSPAGRLILYTASAIVDGIDTFFEAIRPLVSSPDIRFEYREIDPDVFGDELDCEPYRAVDRIAAVSLDLTLRTR